MATLRCRIPLQHDKAFVLKDHLTDVREVIGRQGADLPGNAPLAITRKLSMTLFDGTVMDVVTVEYETG